MDLFEALDLTLDNPIEHSAASLQTATKKRFGLFNSLKQLNGLSFEATDAAFTWGDGPVVSGPSLDLAHAMWGRTLASDAQSGPGLEQFRGQLAV